MPTLHRHVHREWWARLRFAHPTKTSVIRPSHLVRNAVDRTLVGADRRPRHCLDHFARAFGIVDPFLVEVIGAGRDAFRAFAGVDHAGIAAMQQLEEMVLGLTVAARIADQALRQSCVLDAVFFFAGLAQRAAVEADDRGVTEVRIDAIEARGVATSSSSITHSSAYHLASALIGRGIG